MTIVFGSVDRNFIIPTAIDDRATKMRIFLTVSGVVSHIYKLLIAMNTLNNESDLKAIMILIQDLDRIGFPFMRITNDQALFARRDF